MATLTYPYTAANGDTPDATDFMGNFTAVKTLVETTKLDTANLSTPYAQFTFTIAAPAALVGATTYVCRCKVPSSQTWVGVSASFSFTTATAGVPTPTFGITYGGGATTFLSPMTAALPRLSVTTVKLLLSIMLLQALIMFGVWIAWGIMDGNISAQ